MGLGEIVDKIFVAVGLDVSEIDKGMNKLSGKLQGGFKNIMTTVAAPALAAMGGFLSGQFVNDMIQGAAQAGKFGTLLGVSASDMSAWADTANEAGVETEQFVDILTDFADKASDAATNASGPFMELIEQGLIPSFTDADGKMKDTTEIMLELSDVLKNMDAGQAAGLAKRLGINDLNMIALMRRGRVELERNMKAMKAAGGYTDEDAKKAKQFSVALKELARVFRNMLLPVFRVLLPLLAGLAKSFSFVSNHVRALYPVFGLLAVIIGIKLVKAIYAARKAMILFFKGNWRGMALFAVLIALGLLFDDFMTWLEGGKSAFGDFYQSLSDGFIDITAAARAMGVTMERVGEALSWIIPAVTGLWSFNLVLKALQSNVGQLVLNVARIGIAFISAFGPVGWLVSGVIAAFTALGIWLYNNWAEVEAWWADFTANLYAAWASLTDSIMGLWGSVTGFIQSVWDGIVSGLIGTWNGFVSILQNAFTWIGNKFAILGQKWNNIASKLPFGVGSYLTVGDGGGNSYNSSNESTQNYTFNVAGDMTKGTADYIAGLVPNNEGAY